MQESSSKRDRDEGHPEIPARQPAAVPAGTAKSSRCWPGAPGEVTDVKGFPLPPTTKPGSRSGRSSTDPQVGSRMKWVEVTLTTGSWAESCGGRFGTPRCPGGTNRGAGARDVSTGLDDWRYSDVGTYRGTIEAGAVRPPDGAPSDFKGETVPADVRAGEPTLRRSTRTSSATGGPCRSSVRTRMDDAGSRGERYRCIV